MTIADSTLKTNHVKISADSGASVDASGRWRVSEQNTIFDSKLLVDKQPLFWEDYLTGSATSVYNTNQSSVRLNCGASGANISERKTYQSFNYQSGKSLLFQMTFTMSAKSSNTNQEVGIVDNGYKNQVTFGRNGSSSNNKYFKIRSYTSGSSVETIVYQNSWNIDRLDGTGASGIILDETKIQLFCFDFLWQGAGAIRFFFKFNGIPILVHEQQHANLISAPFVSNPNFKLIYASYGNGSQTQSAWIDHICTTVISEGGFNPLGITRSVNLGSTVKTIASGATNAILSIRLKSTHSMGTVIDKKISILAKSTTNFLWQLIFNPTLGGSPSWTALTNGITEYDIVGTTVSGGTIVDSGYGSASLNLAITEIDNALRLGSTTGGVSDILTLAVTNLGVSNEDFLGSLTYKELI